MGSYLVGNLLFECGIFFFYYEGVGVEYSGYFVWGYDCKLLIIKLFLFWKSMCLGLLSLKFVVDFVCWVLN